MSCLKLNIKNIYNMKFNNFTKSYKNILISNFIDEAHGVVKLYKSKKRIELRLHKNIIKHEYTIKLF